MRFPHFFSLQQSVKKLLQIGFAAGAYVTVYEFAVDREGDLFSFRISASGFLYNMARAMVGTVFYVSLGKLRPEEIPAILDAGDRCLAGPTVPPQGLYMTGVWYDGEAGRMMQA